MTPPKPFGVDTKKNIYSAFSLLNPGLGKIQVDVGAPESGYTMDVAGEKATLTFSYVIDNDLDASNGRLILKDSFEIDLKKKKLLDFQRNIEGKGPEDFWSKASAHLNRVQKQGIRSREVRDFFGKVVLKMPLPSPLPFASREEEPESPREPRPREGQKIPVSPAMIEMFRFNRLALLARSSLVEAKSNLLTRRDHASGLTEAQVMMDAQSRYYSESVSSPEMLGALFCGSAAFQMGRAWGAGFTFRSLWLSRFVSTSAGLALEVPAFEMAGRGIRAFKTGSMEMEGFGSSLFKNYLTFGAFRGANSMSRSPLMSFAALHGVNEFERSRGILPGANEDYVHRVMQDAVLFSQLSLSSQLAESTLGRSLGIRSLIPEKVHETQMASFEEMKAAREKAEVWVRRGLHQSGSRVDTNSLEKFYLNPHRDSWILGPLVAEEGFFPDVMAAHEESPPLYIFRDEAGNYFIQRYLEIPGRAPMRVDYYNEKAKLWVEIDGVPIPVTAGMKIRAGRHSFYHIDLPSLRKAAESSAPRQKAADPANQRPLLKLDEFLPDRPVIATILGDATGAVTRELKSHLFVPRFGEVSAFTRVGIDKHVLKQMRAVGLNEDAFGIFQDAEGNLVLIVCDGMGGHDAGDIASQIAVEHMGQRVMGDGKISLAEVPVSAHAEIQANGKKGQTVMGALRIRPDGSVEHASVGDIRFWVIRQMPDGSRRVFEPHLPHTMAAHFRNLGASDFESTIQMNASPLSSHVLSGLGGEGKSLKVVDSLELGKEDQLLYQEKLKINVGTKDKPQWEELLLREGDELVLMSDGVGDLLDEGQFLGLRREAIHAADTLANLEHYTTQALELYIWRYNQQAALDAKVIIPSGHLYAGHYIDFDGNVYQAGAATGTWEMIAHVGPDNTTALIYRHNPQKLAVVPDQKSSPVLPPNPTSTSVPSPTPPAPPAPPVPPNPGSGKLPIEIPKLKIFYGGAGHELSSSDSMELVLGRQHQPSLFGADRPWVLGEHFKIEYVQQKGAWLYKITSLTEEGLSIENQQTGKKRIFKILKKGESLFLSPDTYEFKFKKGEMEWDEALFLTLPLIREVGQP